MLETLEASITFDIAYHANLIEEICEDKLLPEPKGIYANTQLEPVMIDGQDYYTLEPTASREDSVIYKELGRLIKKSSFSPGSVLKLITDINTVKSAVYNKDGKVVVRSSIIKNKARALSNTSFLPYRGIKIIEILVQDHIDCLVAHRRHRGNCYDKISKHLVPDYVKSTFDVFSGDFELMFDELRRDIELFLGNKIWSIYYITLRGTRITIDRGSDYRVNEWEKQHGSNFRCGKYTECAEPDSTDWATDQDNSRML